jgi:hypothetical protein
MMILEQGEIDMNEDAIIARLTALEILSTGAFACLLASVGNDPDLSKSKAILDGLRVDAHQGLAHLPEQIQTEARAYLTDLVNRVLQNVTALRGGPSSAMQ